MAADALTQLVAHYAAQRPEGYATGITYACQLLNLDPCREETHRQLMVLLALSGQRSAAPAQFERCRQLLHEELGLEPTAKTTALYQRLCFASSVTLSPDPERPDFPLAFAGRSGEYATLLHEWQAVRQREGKLTLLQGEAGIGKTRLAEEVLRYLAGQGALGLRGRCHDFQGPLAYHPLIAALRAALPDIQTRLACLDEIWLSELSALLSEIHTFRPDLSTGPRDFETAMRQRLFEAIAQLLSSLSPALLFLDDLH